MPCGFLTRSGYRRLSRATLLGAIYLIMGGALSAQRPVSPKNVAGRASTGPTASRSGYGAIIRWRGAPGSEFSVEYGQSPALGSEVLGRSLGPSSPGGVVGGGAVPNAARRPAPALEVDDGQHVYEALLTGLKPEAVYFYRATLRQNGVVTAQSDVAQFAMPVVAVRIRPHRLDVAKDGDRDVGGRNKGEMHFSWQHTLDPFSPTWADADIIGGCYPAGGTWTIGVPETFRIPVYNITPTPPNQLPSPDNPTYPPEAVTGCVREKSNPWVTVKVNTVKVKSGQTIELRAEPEEWIVRPGLALAAQSASSVRRGLPARVSAPTPGQATGARQRPANRDRDDRDDSGEPPPGAPPAPAPCETRQPRDAFVPVYITVAAFEIDEINDPRTGVPNHRVRKQQASGWDVVCFDLRQPATSIMVGTTGKGEGVKFVGWFQVDLIYRD